MTTTMATVLHSQSKSRMSLYLPLNDKLSLMTSSIKWAPGCSPTCWTLHACILYVNAVMDTPPVMGTVLYPALVPLASHFVHPDQVSPGTVVGPLEGLDGPGVAQLSTHDVGIDDVPVVVADRAPGFGVVDLHPTLVGLVADVIHESDCPCRVEAKETSAWILFVHKLDIALSQTTKLQTIITDSLSYINHCTKLISYNLYFSSVSEIHWNTTRIWHTLDASGRYRLSQKKNTIGF